MKLQKLDPTQGKPHSMDKKYKPSLLISDKGGGRDSDKPKSVKCLLYLFRSAPFRKWPAHDHIENV